MSLITERNLRLATAVICVLLVVMGFLVITPLAVLQASLDGQCLLYADTKDYSPTSVCNYPLAVTTIFQFLYGVTRFILTLLIFLGTIKVNVLSPKRFVLPCVIVDVIACLLTLVSGGLISHGFSVMCSNVFFPNSDRCGTVGIYIAASDNFLHNYYSCLKVAEIGVWPSWILWILLVVLDVLALSKAGLLPDLPASLPFSLPRFGAANGGNSPHRTGTGNVSTVSSSVETGRVAAARAQLTAAPGGGSRTPPPKRPVPPRPGAAPAVLEPLMKENEDEQTDKRPPRPIYRRTVSPT